MHADDIYHLLATGACPEACWGATWRYLDHLGFDRVIYLATSDISDRPSVRTTMPDGFQSFYMDNGYTQDDPFLQYCLSSPVPIDTGKAHMDQYAYLTGRQKDLIATAGDEGFNAGFSVAVRYPSTHGPEGWNLGSSQSAREVEAIKAAHLEQIKPLLFGLSGRLGAAGPTVVLSRRETQCLDLLSRGLRIKAIAVELGIKPVTVDMHLSNARKKMNAPTTKNLLRKYWETAEKAKGDHADPHASF